MDRTIVYPGSIPLDTDLLQINRNTMVAIGALMQVVLGTATVVDGLSVLPTAPNSLAVTVGSGCITSFGVVDIGPFGSLPADTSSLLRMGVNSQPVTLNVSGPAGAGQSVAWLIEAAFVEIDADPVVLPYYNASNPTQPWLGPANAGTAQPTSRMQAVQVQARAGVAAATGGQLPPSTDVGWVALAVVTVTYGQSAVGPGDISPSLSTPLLQDRLPELRPGYASLQAFTSSGTFVVPNGVTRAKVMVIGGGGAGGTHATFPGGGGGAGGRASGIVTGLTPGSAIYVTVGPGGVPSPTPTFGGPGGTSSFGTYFSATGGAGGGGGSVAQPTPGGAGGLGVGATVNEGGSYGTDSVLQAARGGDGGGPGGGRGATGQLAGMAAGGPGGAEVAAAAAQQVAELAHREAMERPVSSWSNIEPLKGYRMKTYARIENNVVAEILSTTGASARCSIRRCIGSR